MQQTQFERVYDFGNLYAGFLKARRGKRGKPSVAKFEANLLEALCLLSIMLKNKTYTVSDYFVFRVYEPKERIVMTNAFAEKGNCYHLIRETDQIFRSLFPESVWLNGKRKARTDGESYFCGYLASPEEVRNTLSEGEKQTRSERTWQRR